jgi:hypothetical protein
VAPLPTRRAAEALIAQVNVLLPHRVGEAASTDRRAAEEAERFAERSIHLFDGRVVEEEQGQQRELDQREVEQRGFAV